MSLDATQLLPGELRPGELETGRSHPVSLPIAVLAATAFTLLVLVAVLPHLWYGFHANSDIRIYAYYAGRMASGLRPYRDFHVEYPPLVIPLFRLPGHATDLAAYMHWFTVEMGVITLATAAVTAIGAARIWPVGGRAYTAGALFAAAVALNGAIIINRYDAAVALLLGVFLLFLFERWYIAAAFVLGLGFALKFTPVALLPLVLVLMGTPRRWGWAIGAFAAAAVAPFLPYLFSSPGGVWYAFHYYLARPLQIESPLGTPMLFGKLIGISSATYEFVFGSWALIAPGVGVAADLSGVIMVIALLVVYGLVWRRRERLKDVPADVSLAVLALILALMTFGKVLSPQYFIWILPAVALVASRDILVAVLAGVTLVLTQIEYPSWYSGFLLMHPAPLSIVIVRNVLLVTLFAVTLWRLWGLPAGADDVAPAPADVRV
jgi:hypothetical protein